MNGRISAYDMGHAFTKTLSIHEMAKKKDIQSHGFQTGYNALSSQ